MSPCIRGEGLCISTVLEANGGGCQCPVQVEPKGGGRACQYLVRVEPNGGMSVPCKGEAEWGHVSTMYG